jgi:hypothetical protein
MAEMFNSPVGNTVRKFGKHVPLDILKVRSGAYEE